jgi:16S rRNA (guanine966-N2)-methyltransferase
LGNKTVNSKVLDLFSGTGSLGIESLSRGCKSVHFVDNSFIAIEIIKHNVKDLRGTEGKYEIIKRDAVKFLERFDDFKMDIIFTDPPYKVKRNTMKEIFNIIAERNIIADNGIIIYEYFFKREIDKEINNLSILKKSFFGDKAVIYLSS